MVFDPGQDLRSPEAKKVGDLEVWYPAPVGQLVDRARRHLKELTDLLYVEERFGLMAEIL